ncbi:hypothetical protein R1flu_002687 [Riccia fluitans]|uniref:DUF659 domain-containing protein n=1 Tax=Riccia fluitans TaxID=41844 RepID=A0ABD1Y6U1_9MARC
MLHVHADGSNMTKDAKWVSGHILNAIKEVDPKNVLQFTGDNPSVNILARNFVRAEYPHIIFGGCVAHGIDLLFEDMEKLAWIGAIFDKCNDIVSFIKNSHQPHTMLMDFFSDGATLLKPRVTRFATNIIMLDRTYHLQHCLKKMVVSEQWTTWVTDPRRPSNTKFKVDNIKQAILDETFWNKTQDLLLLVEPTFRLLRQVDAHKDFMGRIFWESWETQESIKHLWKHKGKDLDDSKLSFDTQEIIGDDEIVEDMRTRAESSMANDSESQNDQDGGIALDKSREQALRHLDDLRDDDFADEDIPPTANEYDVDFDADDVTRTHRHGSSSMSPMEDESGDDSILLEVDESTALRWGVGCVKLDDLNERFPRRRLPRVHLNEAGILLSTNKLRNLVEIYRVPVTGEDSTRQRNKQSRFKPYGKCNNSQPTKMPRTESSYKPLQDTPLPENPIASTSEEPQLTNLTMDPSNDVIPPSPERRRSSRPHSPVNYKVAL